MTPDSHVLLVLLAARLQGTNALVKDVVFKALKSYVADAIAQGLIEKGEVTVVKNGKPQKKKEAVINLTAAGKTYLETHAGPEARTAAVASQTRELQQELRADRDTLRTEILANASKKSKSGDPSKEIKALASKLDALAQAFSNLQARLQQEAGNDVLARIDEAFATLEKRINSRLGLPIPADSTPISKPAQTPTAKSLRQTLREAYETLCLFIEFDSGVVEIPRLYHETRKTIPSLTVHAFHQELESLSSQRILELKVLNEVRSAKEPDKAIRRGENLYYFVFWPNP